MNYFGPTLEGKARPQLGFSPIGGRPRKELTMENKFQSAVSKPLFAFLSIFILGLTLLVAKVDNYFLLSVPITLAVFVYSFLKETYYQLSENTLEIKSGILYKISISYAEIQKIKPSNSIESAPANSFNRLEIKYGKFRRVLISPQNQHEFLRQLQKKAPQLEISGIEI
ncbi:hypothetical protein MASR2M44_17390 [Bacteroidota bacterium]